MGSHIMADACSDCVSEQIAPAILKTLSRLLDEGDTKPLEIEQLNFCLHLMMGKASLKMLEVYRFWQKTPSGSPGLNARLLFRMTTAPLGGLRTDFAFGMPHPGKKRKIPAVVLTASLIRNPDERLQALADELNERCGRQLADPGLYEGDSHPAQGAGV